MENWRSFTSPIKVSRAMALILHSTAASKRAGGLPQRVALRQGFVGTAKAGSPLFEFLISIGARPGEVAEEVRDKSGKK
ncbi:hypothetical protein DdX_00683 [Ditylenchus destructor]|uniref:Uncharacterized protein n=1 Tax=Ditylenchus destructor TaxID=166010 RepID=A0AAD4RDF2_9BILA|nr:hypothetical protein DdX_00683 [Ditylenchus destructor]